MRRQRSDARAGQNETSGGSSETAANELTIRPSGVPPACVVTYATPVAKRPKASRRQRSPGGGSTAAAAWAPDMASAAAARDRAGRLGRGGGGRGAGPGGGA